MTGARLEDLEQTAQLFRQMVRSRGCSENLLAALEELLTMHLLLIKHIREQRITSAKNDLQGLNVAQKLAQAIQQNQPLPWPSESNWQQ